jgi:hypothetical protein
MAIPLRETLLDLLRNVQCNGEQLYTTAYLTGLGSPLPVFTSWAAAWSSLEFKMKYYEGTSTNARQQVAARDVDFGVVSDGSTGGAADIVLTPVIAYSIVPGRCLAFFSNYFHTGCTNVCRLQPTTFLN